MADHWTPETPWFKDDKETEANWPTYVCRNKSCKSYGKSHPNCKCGAPSFSKQSRSLEYAEGGEVHFCSGHGGHLEHCEHFASGGEVEDNTQFEQDPRLAVDHSVIQNGLLHSLTKTGHSRSENPIKSSEVFLDDSMAGKKKLDSIFSNLFSSNSDHKIDSNKDSVVGLRDHLNKIRDNPNEVMNIGGNLGDVFPAHHAQLAAMAGNAISYLNSIRPTPQQAAPLDDVTPPSKIEETNYNRQLAIAQNPALIVQHIRDGTIQPKDIQTLNALYPAMGQMMTQKATGEIINKKSDGKKISYKHRNTLSQFIGQPLDYTQSADAAQAIIRANAPPMAAAPQGSHKKASNKAIDESYKTAQLEATDLQARQMSRKTKM